MSNAKPAASRATVLIHELEAGGSGRHRLIVIRGGIPATSEWCRVNDLGLFKGYFFQNGAMPILPEVFKATPTAHEVLR